MFDINASITGIQQMQDANLRAAAAFETGGALGRRVLDATIGVHRIAVGVTHVDVGALRAAHRIDFSELPGYGAIGVIFIDPTVVNPRSKRRPSEYGLYEHRRGGEHAFYELAVQQAEGTMQTALDGLEIDLRGG